MTGYDLFSFKCSGKAMCLGILWIMLLTIPAYGFFAGKITSFSADFVQISPDGKEISSSRVYVTPEATRMDGMPFPVHPGMSSMNLTSLELVTENKQYLYNHDKKLFFEMSLDDDEQDMMMNLKKMYEKVDEEVMLGKEKVSGYNCTKKRVTTTINIMGMDITSTEIIWQSDRFEMPLRVQQEDGGIFEYRNIDEKKPSPGLFQPLTGYEKVNNIMAVMGMDFSGMDIYDEDEDRPQKDIDEVDADEILAALGQFMGILGGDEEQTAEMREFFSLMMEASREMDMETGTIESPSSPTVGTPPASVALISPHLSQTVDSEKRVLIFDRVEISDVIYNSGPAQLQVFIARQNHDYLYLVQIDNAGKGLVDPVQNVVGYADSAQLLFGGRQMKLNLDEVIAITPSGVDVLAGADKKRIEAWWNESRLAFTVTSLTHVQEHSEDLQVSETVVPGLLFPNSDFEHGDLTNWRASGDAFIYQPTKGDNPTARRRGQPSNHQGDFWIGTFEKYQGDPGQKPGDTQGDRPTGTLTSVPFTITGDSISFLIGGGNHPDATYVALVVNGREVLKATGNNHESMKRVTWDVSSFRGQEGRILIVDGSDRGWGHINADDFRYDDGE